MKICNMCKEEKTDDSFHKHYLSKDGLASHCKKCHTEISKKSYLKKRQEIGIDGWRKKTRESMKKWRSNNPERVREINKKYKELHGKEYNLNRRQKLWKITKHVYKKYGGKCDCCSEKNLLFLTLDHINSDGKEHRKIIKESSLPLWAYKNNYPKNLRLLCFNCNLGREMRGGKNKICPHKLLDKIID